MLILSHGQRRALQMRDPGWSDLLEVASQVLSTAEGLFEGPWSPCWDGLPRIPGNSFAFNLCAGLLAEVPGICLPNISEGKRDHKARALGYAYFVSGPCRL